MKIKAIIIEDIQSYIDTLLIMLSKYKEIDVVATATNKHDAIEVIKMHKPDILFMDIQLGKNSGFEILDECIDDFNSVIFTTSHDEFALKGYTYRVLHYLLKPIDETALQAAIEKAKKHFQEPFTLDELKNSIFKISNLKSKKIYFPDKNIHHSIEIDSIIYLGSDAAYTDIYTLSKNIKVSKNLSTMQDMLSEYPEFIRVHRSFVININHILNLKRGPSSTILLTNGFTVPISNSEKDYLFKILGIKE